MEMSSSAMDPMLYPLERNGENSTGKFLAGFIPVRLTQDKKPGHEPNDASINRADPAATTVSVYRFDVLENATSSLEAACGFQDVHVAAQP